jgi:transcriptional regulator with XRE-family HTH domain
VIQVHKRIEKVREQKGVTKAFIAKKLGITPMAYHYLATGRTPINTDRLLIIADALGVPAEEFLRPELNETVTDGTEQLA